MALDAAGIEQDWCLLSGGALAEKLKTFRPTMLWVHAEPGSEVLGRLLGLLDRNPELAALPVVLLCADVKDAGYVRQLKTGVIELLQAPFSAKLHVARLRLLPQELKERTGTIRGRGAGRDVKGLLEHLVRGRRSGTLVVNEGAGDEGRAFFVKGAVKHAWHAGQQGPASLAAIAGLPHAEWQFSEGADGAGGFIEWDSDDHGDVTQADPFGADALVADEADVAVVGGQLVEEPTPAAPARQAAPPAASARAPARQPAAPPPAPQVARGVPSSSELPPELDPALMAALGPPPPAAAAPPAAPAAAAPVPRPVPTSSAGIVPRPVPTSSAGIVPRPVPASSGSPVGIPLGASPVPPTDSALEPAPHAAETPILFVDDDPSLTRMFSTYFSKKGYPVDTAADGVEAMQKLLARQTPFEVVIADLNMPRLDGWGLLRVIREDVRTQETPVALFSAHDDYRESLRAVHAGAQAFYPKTLRMNSLETQVRELLEPRRRFVRLLQSQASIAQNISALGAQWSLEQISRARVTGQLDALDAWATYRLHFTNGQLTHVSAAAANQQLGPEQALFAFISGRGIEGTIAFGSNTVPSSFGDRRTSELLAWAAGVLNEQKKKLREEAQGQARELVVNQELYQLYAQVGPPAWRPIAQLLCEMRLVPRDIISRLQVTPADVAAVVNDLVLRGVVSFKT